MAGRLFDPACFDLAEHFLSDYKAVKAEDTDKLAATIQEAIEDWLRLYEEEYLRNRDA